jgi:cytochrome c-type biogenesis protein CcmH/NrfG
MAQFAQTGRVTPADELRELLAVAEKRLANVRGSGESALTLLKELDRVAELWPELEAQGVDLRPESGRWVTVQRMAMQKARSLLAELKGLGGIAKLRAAEHPRGTDAPWWNIDSYARERSRQSARRLILSLAAVVVLGVGLYFLLFRVLFPVDPKVQESVRRVGEGEHLVQQESDFAGALVQFETAAAATPDDPDVWLRVGAVREQLGDDAGAEEAFDRARRLSASDLDFFRARGAAYLALVLVDPAEKDLSAALQLKYDDAQSWYLMANVFESRQQLAEAIDALDKAGQYASETNQAQLTAMARYRMGMLIQQMQMQVAPPPGETGAVPAP